MKKFERVIDRSLIVPCPIPIPIFITILKFHCGRSFPGAIAVQLSEVKSMHPRLISARPTLVGARTLALPLDSRLEATTYMLVSGTSTGTVMQSRH